MNYFKDILRTINNCRLCYWNDCNNIYYRIYQFNHSNFKSKSFNNESNNYRGSMFYWNHYNGANLRIGIIWVQKMYVYLTSLVAISIIAAGLLATALHSIILALISILELILVFLVLITNKGHYICCWKFNKKKYFL